MNRNPVNYIFLIVLVLAITYISLLTPFKKVVSQVDPSQEQIEPIPPSNNTNQTAPIGALDAVY
jgi:hypothetical protein